MRLYEMVEDFIRLQDMIEEGEIDPEVLADTLEAIEGSIEEKADGYAKVKASIEVTMQGIDGQVNALKAEIDRLTSRKRTMQNNIDSMMKHLEGGMRATGKLKFKTDMFSFGIQKVTPSVVLDDQAVIPDIYFKEKTTRSVDKTAIKKAIKEGEDVPGAHIEQKEVLRIR